MGVLPGDARGVGPQSFEPVELARRGEKDVHDEVAVIEQDPRRVIQPLDGPRLDLGLLPQLLLDLVHDGADLPGVRRTGDDEGVDDADDVSDVEDDGVFALLVVRSACGKPGFRGGVGHVPPWKIFLDPD